jgi:hypothetical protein
MAPFWPGPLTVLLLFCEVFCPSADPEPFDFDRPLLGRLLHD